MGMYITWDIKIKDQGMISMEWFDEFCHQDHGHFNDLASEYVGVDNTIYLTGETTSCFAYNDIDVACCEILQAFPSVEIEMFSKNENDDYMEKIVYKDGQTIYYDTEVSYVESRRKQARKISNDLTDVSGKE